eukprot:TCALIF_06815-PA protein Name:"Protein of unknown function" AED:0.55 eAED:0.79 QI:183/0/0.5/1/0/0/2/0/290
MDMSTDILRRDKIKNNEDGQLTPPVSNEIHSNIPQKEESLQSITDTTTTTTTRAATATTTNTTIIITTTTTTRPIETEVVRSSFPLNSTPSKELSNLDKTGEDVEGEEDNHPSGEATRHSHVHVQGVCHHDPDPDFNPMASQEGVTNETNRPSPPPPSPFMGTHTMAQSNPSPPSPMNPRMPDNESLLHSISKLSLNSRLSLANDIKEKLEMEKRRQKLRKKSKVNGEHRSRKWKSIVSPVNGKFSLRTMRVFTPGNFTALKNERGTSSSVKRAPLTKLKANPFININIL